MEFVLPRPVGERIVTDGYRNTPVDSEISCSGVTLADYENYLNALGGAGCAFYDTNTLAENRSISPTIPKKAF